MVNYYQDPYYEPDYFNEEEENRYLAEHHQSPDNNIFESGEYPDEYTSHSNDNNNDRYGTYSNDSKSQTHNNSSKLKRNDSNNNANGLYDYQQTSYDDQMDDKTKLGLNNNAAVAGDYYKMYDDKDDDRHYEEEFDNEYAPQNSVTTLSKQMMHKQMSILDEDAHQHDEFMNDKNKMMLNGEHKTIDEEYLDEFDEDDMLRRKSETNGFIKKQESVMEDDPELKHLEEAQHLKSQQQQQHQQFQDLEHDNELDQFDIEMKQKKSVTIDDEVIIHEKPREKRTAKQRWHWAYNRIVHQAQVSQKKTKLCTEPPTKVLLKGVNYLQSPIKIANLIQFLKIISKQRISFMTSDNTLSN